MRGQHIEPLTDDIKDKFLDYIEAGYTRPEAAAAVDQSARVFRSICNPNSHRYDENFARQYEALTEKDGLHERAMLERLENAAFERALRSSDRLLEKLLINKSPEWAIHRPQAMQINFNKTEQLAVILPELSTEEILQLRDRIENGIGQIEAGPPVIDVDAK